MRGRMCLEENILNGSSSKISASGSLLQCLDMNSFTHVMACKINSRSNKQGTIPVKYRFCKLEWINNFPFSSKCQVRYLWNVEDE